MDHDQLPLPDYDHLPASAVRNRIRSLSEAPLRQLLDYEVAHANRLPIVETMRHRLGQLEAGAEPTAGHHDVRPEQPPPPAAGTPVEPARKAPATNPPPHGDPAQPAKPKGDRQV